MRATNDLDYQIDESAMRSLEHVAVRTNEVEEQIAVDAENQNRQSSDIIEIDKEWQCRMRDCQWMIVDANQDQ